MGDTCHARDLDGGVENSVSDFYFIKDSGGVHSGDESMSMYFPLSFFEIL